MKPTAEIRTITPAWARTTLAEHDRRLVAGTFRQRRITPDNVEKYATDMTLGNWSLTGQGITFDTDGNLVDGQHRLYAVVKANVNVDMLVVTGAKSAKNNFPLIDFIDCGKARSLSNQLHIGGVSYPFHVASTVSCIINSCFTLSRGRVSVNRGVALANMVETPCLRLLQILSKGNRAKSVFSGSVLAPLVVFRSCAQRKADAFAKELNEMTNLSATSPVLHFARFLDRPRLSTRGRDLQTSIFRGLASALYSYDHDKPVEQIRGNDGHMEWLLRKARPFLTEVQKVIGVEKTIRYLESK